MHRKNTYEIHELSTPKEVRQTYENLLDFYAENKYQNKINYSRIQREKLQKIYEGYLTSKNTSEFSNFINSIIHFSSEDRNLVNNLEHIDFYRYSIKLEELYNNKVKIKEKCVKCHSLGKSIIQTCGKCKGDKRLTFIIFNHYNFRVIRVECEECEGYGEVGIGGPCTECDGKRYHSRNIPILLPKDANEVFKYPYRLGDGQENEYFFSIIGDDRFQKHGKDLNYIHTIHLSELIYGFSFDINLLGKCNITVKNREGLVYDPDRVYIIPGLGFTDETGIGDLHISFKVVYPHTLEEFEKDRFKISIEDKKEENCIFYIS